MTHTLETELPKSFLSIRSGEDTFAINETYLKHVIEIDTIQPIPSAPSYVAGTCVFLNKIYTLICCNLLIEQTDNQSDLKFIKLLIEDKNLVALVINHPALHSIAILGTHAHSEQINTPEDWEDVSIPNSLRIKSTELTSDFLLRKLH